MSSRFTASRTGGTPASHPSAYTQGQEVYTSSSETCPAGQPVLAVNVRRRNLTSPAGTVIVAVLPVAGSNVRPAAPDIVRYDDPSTEPATATVCVRVAQAAAGGNLSTTRRTLTVEPRSTVSVCGKALFVLSQ